MNYGDRLKDPRWQRKRLEIMQRDEWRCRTCNASDSTLHVHHNHYLGDAEGPWDYHDSALVTLCEPCHSAVHDHGGWDRGSIAPIRSGPLWEAIALLVHYPDALRAAGCLPDLFPIDDVVTFKRLSAVGDYSLFVRVAAGALKAHSPGELLQLLGNREHLPDADWRRIVGIASQPCGVSPASAANTLRDIANDILSSLPAKEAS